MWLPPCKSGLAALQDRVFRSAGQLFPWVVHGRGSVRPRPLSDLLPTVIRSVHGREQPAKAPFADGNTCVWTPQLWSRRLAERTKSDFPWEIIRRKEWGSLILFVLLPYFYNETENNRKDMKARTAKWFETKVKYDKLMENGLMKPVTEAYVVDALSFSETETRITEEMQTYLSGEMTITDIKPASYKEIFFSDMEADDRWFKAKLQFITIDEKTEKEKRQNIYYLVQAGTMQRAVKAIDEVMGKTMIDYTISSLNETNIIDVFEHKLKAAGDDRNDKPEYEQ